MKKRILTVCISLIAAVLILPKVTLALPPCSIPLSVSDRTADTLHVVSQSTPANALVMDLALANSNADGVISVAQITITGSGTGDEFADIDSAKLYLDDGDGIFNAGDTEISTGNFGADDGTLVFTMAPSELVIPIGETTYAFVEYVVKTTTAKDSTFVASIAQNTDVDLEAGVGCDDTAGVTGAPVNSGTHTMTWGDATVAAGANNPSSVSAKAGDTNVPVMQFALTPDSAEGLLFNNVTVTDPSAANNADKITAVRLWVDVNNDGVVTSGTDVQLGTDKAFTAGVDTLNFSAGDRLIAAGSTENYLITYDFASTATASLSFKPALKAFAKKWITSLIAGPLALVGCGGSESTAPTDNVSGNLSAVPEGFVYTDASGNTITSASEGDVVQVRTADGLKVLQFVMGADAVSLDGATLSRDATNTFVALPTSTTTTTSAKAVSGLPTEIDAFVPCDTDDNAVQFCTSAEMDGDGNVSNCGATNLLVPSADEAGGFTWTNSADRTGEDDCTVSSTTESFTGFYASGKTQYTFSPGIDNADDVKFVGDESDRDVYPASSAVEGGAVSLIME